MSSAPQRSHADPKHDSVSSHRPAAPQSDNVTGSLDPLLLQRALSNPSSASPSLIGALQRSAGNQAVRRMLSGTAGKLPIQTKLMVGPSGDAYEQEADRVAAQVVNMAPVSAPDVARQESEEEEALQMKPLSSTITPVVHRRAVEEEELQMKPLVQRESEGVEMEEEELQMKPLVQRESEGAEMEEEELQMKPLIQRSGGEAGFEAGADLESRLSASKGGGQALPDEVRADLEPKFGADFGSVRVHTGGEAVQMNRDISAQAFTHGSDIYFGEGKFDPRSGEGKHLLAHELTHVVQQTGAVQTKRVSQTAQPAIQRLKITDDPIDFDQVTSLKRSGEGLDGVFFVSDGTDSLVVKPDSGAASAEVAHSLLAGVGVGVPKSRFVAYSSTEGQGIVSMIERFRGEIEEGMKSTPSRLDAFRQGLAKKNHFTVMGKIAGKDLASLGAEDIVTVLTSKGVLIDMGRTFAVDFFMGNGDRFYEKANLGNLMFDADSGSITTLDNASKFDKVDAGKLQSFHALVSDPGLARGYLSMFINKLKGKIPEPQKIESLAKINDDQVMAWLQMGVQDGIQSLLALTQDPEFRKKLDFSNHSASEEKNQKGFEDSSKYLDMAVKGLKLGKVNRKAHLKLPTGKNGKLKDVGPALEADTVISYFEGQKATFDSREHIKAIHEPSGTEGWLGADKLGKYNKEYEKEATSSKFKRKLGKLFS